MMPFPVFHPLRRFAAGMLVFFSGLSAALVSAETCLLPRHIGTPNGASVREYQASCDTVRVAAGDTCAVHEGTLFHFSDPRYKNRIIEVYGTLLVGNPGKTGAPIFIAGSTTDTGLVLLPGGERFGGIRVRQGGALRMHGAALVNADTALELDSRRVWIEGLKFTGCRLVLDTGRIVHALRNPDQKSFPWDPTLMPPKTPAKRNLKPYWVGGGLAALGAVGFAAYLFWDDGRDSPSPGDEFDAPPSLPESPVPR